MTATGAALSGRRRAEQLMTDTCTVTRAGAGQGTVNDATLQLTPPTPSTIYTGKCRIRPLDLADRAVDVEERRLTLRHLVVSLPTSAAAVAVDDSITITACVLDQLLVTHVFTIFGIAQGSQVTARRLYCREKSS